jgi:hypothetical protein
MFYHNSPQWGGGETTFPLAPARALATASGGILTGAASAVSHAGMPECDTGLRVQPFAGGGALFYHKLGDGTNDPLSSHAGCPPLPAPQDQENVAWKINGFMWNMDADKGPRMFDV